MTPGPPLGGPGGMGPVGGATPGRTRRQGSRSDAADVRSRPPEVVMTPIRRALALALVLTPPLLTAEELLRSSVVPEGGSTAEQLRSVAAGAGWWRAYVLVGALSIVAFTAALLGFVAALQHRAPRLAAVGGALALLMAVAQALHLAFEGVLTAALAARPGEVAAADHVIAQLEGDPLGSGSILLFIGTTTVVPFLLAAAL